jgi:uncharacterized protein YbjT (DUF2867 family)
MARVLIVGCGCRGRALAGTLRQRGHAVRGTTRHRDGLSAIEAAGAEAVIADPARLTTLLPHLEGTSVLCWLLGSADGEPDELEALHGPRLVSLLETLVDTHVRGAVYESAGTVPQAMLDAGAERARRAADAYRMPLAVVTEPPSDSDRWVESAADAVDFVLSA